jgi:hypothetical protein
MQLKHAIAAGISVLILCVSSFASVCELSCSLTHPAKHPTRHSSAQQTSETSMSMSECGHAMTRKADRPADRSCEDTSTCSGTPCDQAPVFVSQLTVRQNPSAAVHTQFVSIATRSHQAIIDAGFDVLQPARMQVEPPLIGPLSLALRI